LAVEVAAFVVGQARRAVKAQGRFSLALAGGATPRLTYEYLARPPFAELLPWKQTHVFWGDERCVDPADPRSNELMARTALLDHVPLPRDHVHTIRCQGGPADAADRYEVVLRAQFGVHEALDLMLLGLGEDGHTASLFPGSGTLDERERWVVAAVAPATGEQRVTMTIPFINRAAAVLFLAYGKAKAGIVKEVLEGTAGRPSLPAQRVHPQSGRLIWHLDDEAAALLCEQA
jgi:6-phosphogluconolactonase